nr:8934_t:CDS:2 [Entrophospora candida]
MIILIKTKKGWSWGDRSGGDGKIGKYGLFYNNNTGTGTYDPSFDRTWGRFRCDIDKVFDDCFSGGGIGGRDREGYGGAGIVGSPITWAQERHYGHFMRSLPLPTNVDRDKVDARLDLGVLEIKLLLFIISFQELKGATVKRITVQ